MDTATLIRLVVGLGGLIWGADLLVRGASRLSIAFGISPLVVGLTVVAFGTSAPELAVSVQGALGGNAEIAVGNVVGSNICNVLLILGVAALVAPLTVARKLVRFDVPLMIGVSVLVMVLALDGQVARWEGGLLFAGIVGYTIFAITQSRREQARATAAADEPPQKRLGTAGLLLQLLFMAAGLAMLVIGSDWLVAGAVAIARQLGVSDLVIGLTVVAVGTSLPEVATSVVASFKGERDIAVGNVVGSNLFNLLCVLGLSSLVAPGGLPVSPAVLTFDLPVMVATAIACLPILFTGYSIDRWEGAVFLGYYAAFIGFVVLKSVEHDSLPFFSMAMMAFVVPITVLTLTAVTFQAIRRSRAAPG